MSIRSVLIKSSMTKINKEMNQLEHWLMNLNTEEFEPNTNHLINKISDQISHQQLSINNILERLDRIEGFQTSKEVFIDKTDKWADPYMDNNCEPLDETFIEPLYTVYKNDPEVEEVEEVVNVVKEVVEEAEEVVKVTKEEVVEEAEEVVKVTKEEVVEVVKAEVVKAEVVEVVKAEVVKEEVVEVVKEEVVEVVKAEVEEAEEEGIELEEITYNNVIYYKDPENFIYSVTNGEPSDNPVGYWKENTKKIVFYKKITT
jgi:hypothetical protein